MDIKERSPLEKELTITTWLDKNIAHIYHDAQHPYSTGKVIFPARIFILA